MSRFDMLGSWMQGSQLGTSQYGQLAGMAQNEAALRQRQAEEAAQQEQFAARQALDQQQFGEHQRMNTATLDRWGQQAAWENEDRAREAALREQEQQQLSFMREWMKERARGAAASAGGGRSMLPAEAMNAGGMMGRDATAFLPAEATGVQMQADPPETQKLMRLIDNADGAGLKAMMPYLDDVQQQRRLARLVDGIDRDIGQVGVLGDPNHRAIYQAYRAANDPDGMMKVMNGAMQEAQKAKAMQAEYDQRIRLAREVAAFKAQHGSSAPTINQRLSAAKTMMAQAEKEYRALSGQSGKTGALAEPSKAVRKSAEDFAGGTGHWFKTDATQERHGRQVAAWDKYLQAVAEYDAVVSGMYQQAAGLSGGQQRGLLDGPEQGQQQGADPEAIYQQIKAEMPNATEEQMAAELTRRMQGG